MSDITTEMLKNSIKYDVSKISVMMIIYGIIYYDEFDMEYTKKCIFFLIGIITYYLTLYKVAQKEVNTIENSSTKLFLSDVFEYEFALIIKFSIMYFMDSGEYSSPVERLKSMKNKILLELFKFLAAFSIHFYILDKLLVSMFSHVNMSPKVKLIISDFTKWGISFSIVDILLLKLYCNFDNDKDLIESIKEKTKINMLVAGGFVVYDVIF